MPVITLPDGTQKIFDHSVTVLEIAQSIGAGLAKATIAGKVNGILLDATLPIKNDSKVVIITSKDKEGFELSSPSFDSKNGKIRAPTRGSSTIADSHGKEFKFIL